MAEVNSLQAEHGQIQRLASRLSRMVMRPLPPPPTELDRMRHEFAISLSRHLKHEDAIVYPRLLQSRREEVRKIARRLIAESGALAARFEVFCARWSSAAIAADWPGFRYATSELLGLIEQRIAGEEYELLPLLAAETGDGGGGFARWGSVAADNHARLRLLSGTSGDRASIMNR